MRQKGGMSLQAALALLDEDHSQDRGSKVLQAARGEALTRQSLCRKGTPSDKTLDCQLS